jgi:small subunit ribosomal protein S2e
MASRGFGRGGRKKDQRGKGPRNELDDWVPVTKLGRLIKSGKITSLDEIFRFSIPIKEPEIVDHLIKKDLKEEVMFLKPVQKQTPSGQRTRFKSYAVIGDSNGHIGLGGKVAKEVPGAIKGAISDAKLNIIPIRRGYYGNKISTPHTVPCKVTGKGGSVRIRLIPAPRGTGIVGAPTPKKVLQMAGVGDCYTSSRGNSRTKGNTLKAVYNALENTYSYLTPDLWGITHVQAIPFEENTKYLNNEEVAE